MKIPTSVCLGVSMSWLSFSLTYIEISWFFVYWVILDCILYTLNFVKWIWILFKFYREYSFSFCSYFNMNLTQLNSGCKSISSVQFSSVTQSCPTLCDPMNHSMARPPCPSPTPRVYSNSCPSSRWCHPAISSFVVPFSKSIPSFYKLFSVNLFIKTSQ